MPAAEEKSPASPPAARTDEVDVWWGGYASRTMLPSFLACLAITVAMVVGAVALVVHHQLPALEARSAVYAIAGLLWVIETSIWLYRVTGFTYRLTNRKLYPFWGFLLPPPAAISLGEVREVMVEQTALERFLKVGRIRLDMAGPQAPIVLLGIVNPQQVAEEIERCVKSCQAAQVQAGSR